MFEALNKFADPNFVFNEEDHIYTYVDQEYQYPLQTFTSVTGFTGRFKEPFATDYWAYKKAQKRGVSKQVILNEWKEIALIATDLGTDVHKWIEDYYNGLNPPLPTEERRLFRINGFLELYKESLHRFKPVAQELRIFSRKWGLAGTIDALFELNGRLYIGDWKTNKKFTDNMYSEKDYFKKKLKYPFHTLWDNSINGYSLQLGTYAAILKEEAGIDIAGSFLCWIGPESKPKLYKTVDIRDQLIAYLEKEKIN